MNYKIYIFIVFYFCSFNKIHAQEKVSKTETIIGDTNNTIKVNLSSILPSNQNDIYIQGREWVFQLKPTDREGDKVKKGNLKLSLDENGAWFKGVGKAKKVGIVSNSSSFSFQLPDIGQPSFINIISYSYNHFNLVLANREAGGQGLRISLPEYIENKVAWSKEYNDQLIDTVFVKSYSPFEKQQCQLMKNTKIECFKNFKTYETKVGIFILNYWFDPIKFGILKVEIIHPDDKTITLDLTKTNY